MHRILSKNGHPVLYLPTPRRAATETMRLYPAQRPAAVAARGLVKCIVATGLPLPLRRGEPPTVAWSVLSWTNAAPTTARQPPASVGVLAGNPFAPGRRFIYLAFDEQDKPIYIAKCGWDAAARARICAERDLLLTQSRTNRHMPPVWGTITTATMDAVILPYCPGSPSPAQISDASVDQILSSWIVEGEQITWGDLCQQSGLAGLSGMGIAADRQLAPVLYHGDFAPWNIASDRTGELCVLDWERGVMPGVPTWDWFHYEVQKLCLVDRAGAHIVRARIDALLASSLFQRYADRAGVRGLEQALWRGYLQHALHLQKQAQDEPVAEQVKRVLGELLAQ